ncbi:MAG: chromate transporter [Bacteroidetes bacterium GWA2_31_9]|nr:MAG: chromate transporter [Bacteroidetes bacterium GWA2_31_9]
MNKNNLKELAKLFTKLGFISFGGPAVHTAMMYNEVVVKRKWLEEQHFLDLVGATNLIPGPNSTELAIHIGYEKGGWKGLIIAGICFILPAVIITTIFAWFYKNYGQLPQIQPFIYGIKPALIAIILVAIYPLFKKSFKTLELGLIGIMALLLSLLKFNEIYIMFGAGLFAILLDVIKNNKSNSNIILPLLLFQFPKFTFLTSLNLNLFLIFLKIGAILYGSGYVLFAFLDNELVARGLISRNQLIDAVAVGQFTPGPIFSSVTFIGYQISGLMGAIVSTLGIFLPSFIFVALLNPIVKKLKNSKLFSAFLDAVNITSVAIIIAICFQLGQDSITDWRTIVIAIMSLIILFKFKKFNNIYIVLGSSILGYILLLI